MTKPLKVLTQRKTRRQWVEELDVLAREVVYLRDGKCCVRCGRTAQLAPSHVYPKGKYTRLRHDTDNILTLCFACHICWWHKNPIEASQWFGDKYPDRAKKLKLRSQISWKGPSDYQGWKLLLKNELKNLTK